jgi:hypothetical protein
VRQFSNVFKAAFLADSEMEWARRIKRGEGEDQLCPAGGPAVDLSVQRSDRLQLVDVEQIDTKKNFYDLPFIRLFSSVQPVSFVVLNRGAHYEETPKVIKGLQAVLAFLFCQNPKVSVIWRTTVPGIENPNADFFKAPLKKYEEPAWNSRSVRFNYDKILKQNIQVREFLVHAYPQVLILDALPSATLRVDSHADFLHNCIPGPINNWVTLLYNALLLVDRVES